MDRQMRPVRWRMPPRAHEPGSARSIRPRISPTTTPMPFSRRSTISSSPDRPPPTSATCKSSSFAEIDSRQSTIDQRPTTDDQQLTTNDQRPTMLSKEQILKLMRDKVTHPATPRELLRTLKIPRDERATFRRLMKSLVTTGELVQTKGGRVGLPDKMDLVVGRLETHANGFGFVIPDKTGDASPDVYVSAANIKEAMHGDRVLARIERKSVDGRLEGRIIRILA